MSPLYHPLPPCEVLIQNVVERARQRDPNYQDIDPRNNEIAIAPLQSYESSDCGQYDFPHLLPSANGCRCIDCQKIHSVPPVLKPARAHALSESRACDSIGEITVGPDRKCLDKCLLDQLPFGQIEPRELQRLLQISSMSRHIRLIPITNLKAIAHRITFREKAPLQDYPGVSVPAVLAREDVLVDALDQPLQSLTHVSIIIMLPSCPVIQYTILKKTLTRLNLAEQLCALLYNLLVHKDTVGRLRLCSISSGDLQRWFVELAY